MNLFNITKVFIVLLKCLLLVISPSADDNSIYDYDRDYKTMWKILIRMTNGRNAQSINLHEMGAVLWRKRRMNIMRQRSHLEKCSEIIWNNSAKLWFVLTGWATFRGLSVAPPNHIPNRISKFTCHTIFSSPPLAGWFAGHDDKVFVHSSTTCRVNSDRILTGYGG